MNTLNALQIKEQIAELVERLEENGSYSLSFYEEYRDDFAINKDLNSMIIEWSWSLVDVFYSKLWSWVREYAIAQDYIQRAVAEGLADTRNFNLYETIKTAQFLFYSDEVYADYATLEQLHKLHQELHELEQEQVA
jgi:hypothetical protein